MFKFEHIELKYIVILDNFTYMYLNTCRGWDEAQDTDQEILDRIMDPHILDQQSDRSMDRGRYRVVDWGRDWAIDRAKDLMILFIPDIPLFEIFFIVLHVWDHIITCWRHFLWFMYWTFAHVLYLFFMVHIYILVMIYMSHSYIYVLWFESRFVIYVHYYGLMFTYITSINTSCIISLWFYLFSKEQVPLFKFKLWFVQMHLLYI